MESILNTIKQNLGVEESDTSFDVDIIMHINSAISTLMTLGLETTLVVQDFNDIWDDLIGVGQKFSYLKSYIYLKVRLAFDPPNNSFLVTAIESQIKEYEYRFMTTSDTDKFIEEEEVEDEL